MKCGGDDIGWVGNVFEVEVYCLFDSGEKIDGVIFDLVGRIEV